MPGNVRWTRQGRKYILCSSNGANVDGGADQALLSIVVKISEDGFWPVTDNVPCHSPQKY
jgi:hypothetical protein